MQLLLVEKEFLVKMTISDRILEWFLSGDPWIKYRVNKMIRHLPSDHPELLDSHKELISHQGVIQLIEGIMDWPGPPIASHKSARHPMHILSFLVDLGIQADDRGIDQLVNKILSHQSSQGPFQMLSNVSPTYGGSGKDEFAWALCDAPLVVYSLVKLGYSHNPQVQSAIDYLVGLVRENGWPCAVSPELGNWRGPGRKNDPCPYATLVMLKLLAELPQYHNSDAVKIGAHTLLSLWQNSMTIHPYIFYMGDDFRKLKAPLVWYDILHVTDVLSRFSWLKSDPILNDMLKIVLAKADSNGLFVPESVYMSWKDWDFGQKKEPSRYLTLRIHEIIDRMNGNFQHII